MSESNRLSVHEVLNVNKVRLFVFYVLLFIFPVFVHLFYLINSGVFTSDVIMDFYLNPATLVAILVCDIGWPVFFWKFNTHVFYGYDGTEEKLKKANRCFKIFPGLTVVSPIISNCIICAVALSTLDLPHDVHFAACWLAEVSAICLYSLLFYVFFYSHFEFTLYKIPLHRGNTGMDLVIRSSLIAFFSSAGALLSVIFSFINKVGQVQEFYSLIFSEAIPYAIIGGVVGIATVFMNQKSNKMRLFYINEYAEILAKNDYSTENTKVLGRDDYGILVNSMNSLANATRSLLINILKTAESSKSSTETVTRNMNRTTQLVNDVVVNINNIKNEIEDQAADVTETQSTITQIASNINELNENIENQSQSVSKASSAIEQLVASIKSVTGILIQNAEQVNELDAATAAGQKTVEEAVRKTDKIFEESKGLLEASSIIQHIAEQTNLLAMNAAIEAAHAGEVGKGFSVVADEIRKLAEETNEQSKSISDRLQNLGNTITEVNSNTKEVQKQFETIFNMTKDVKTKEEVIAQAMQEQDAGSVQILEAVHNINDITSTVKDRSMEMLEGSKEITREMENLSKITNVISNAVTEMNESTSSITEAAESTSSYAENTLEIVNDLYNTVTKFKV
ncbi:MAG: hypothetical protein J5780_07050 [Treponema sp.]|nr:hypothetical protein [Treponema sp.]